MKTYTHSSSGKIACLPHPIREQLNHRLRDGQRAADILPWLNGLPTVQKILADQFSGAPVNSQNLSNWRALGYQRWLKNQNPSLDDLKTSSGHAPDPAIANLARNSSPEELRAIAALLLSLVGDERANLIANAPMDEADKTELLGLYLYGDSWIPRHLSDALKATANHQGGHQDEPAASRLSKPNAI